MLEKDVELYQFYSESDEAEFGWQAFRKQSATQIANHSNFFQYEINFRQVMNDMIEEGSELSYNIIYFLENVDCICQSNSHHHLSLLLHEPRLVPDKIKTSKNSTKEETSTYKTAAFKDHFLYSSNSVYVIEYFAHIKYFGQVISAAEYISSIYSQQCKLSQLSVELFNCLQITEKQPIK